MNYWWLQPKKMRNHFLCVPLQAWPGKLLPDQLFHKKKKKEQLNTWIIFFNCLELAQSEQKQEDYSRESVWKTEWHEVIFLFFDDLSLRAGWNQYCQSKALMENPHFFWSKEPEDRVWINHCHHILLKACFPVLCTELKRKKKILFIKLSGKKCCVCNLFIR